jgi:hypothetical protein
MGIAGGVGFRLSWSREEGGRQRGPLPKQNQERVVWGEERLQE